MANQLPTPESDDFGDRLARGVIAIALVLGAGFILIVAWVVGANGCENSEQAGCDGNANAESLIALGGGLLVAILARAIWRGNGLQTVVLGVVSIAVYSAWALLLAAVVNA